MAVLLHTWSMTSGAEWWVSIWKTRSGSINFPENSDFQGNFTILAEFTTSAQATSAGFPRIHWENSLNVAQGNFSAMQGNILLVLGNFQCYRSLFALYSWPHVYKNRTMWYNRLRGFFGTLPKMRKPPAFRKNRISLLNSCYFFRFGKKIHWKAILYLKFKIL